MNDLEHHGPVWLSLSPDADPVRGVQIGTWRGRLIRLAFILGIWTLVGFFFASQSYFFFRRAKQPLPFLDALIWQMAASYVLAAATPLVLWLSARFRIEGRQRLRGVIIHVVVGTLVASALGVVHAIIDIAFYYGTTYLSAPNVIRSAFAGLDKELIIYWLIVLISHASSYYKSYRESQLAASHLATQLAEAQLKALKMQLHPHFLFNTLHSISSLLSKDTEAARKMIAHLGDFLRLTLENSGDQEVDLLQELEFLKCYLEIERIRFNDRLTTYIDVDPKALNCQVPNLILQPIVENAIRHGIAPRSTPGRIEVKARLMDGLLRLNVIDNGPGIPAGADPIRLLDKGIGVANTRARLIQIYGDHHRFELANDPKGGLNVTIEIPAVTQFAAIHSSVN
jgi:two-component system LytT family sensor kinase